MSNYASSGTDFDTIFEPRQVGDPAMSDVNYAESGVDLADIYAPASVGTPAGNVGYLLGGSDIGPLFALLGSRAFTATLTRGQFSDSGIFFRGYWTGNGIGGLSPNTYVGSVIGGIYTHSVGGVSWTFIVRIAGVHAQNFFATIQTSVGTFNSASASFTNSGESIWQWSGASSFATSGTEIVTIV